MSNIFRRCQLVNSINLLFYPSELDVSFAEMLPRDFLSKLIFFTDLNIYYKDRQKIMLPASGNRLRL